MKSVEILLVKSSKNKQVIKLENFNEISLMRVLNTFFLSTYLLFVIKLFYK